MDSTAENPSTTRFREYLRIQSVQPQPDYDGIVRFLLKMADEIGLEKRTLELSPGRPIVILTWRGTQPQLRSVILSSHTDVVPVFEEFWTYPPFAAHKDKDGNIYARGTQDMKSVTIQYLEAIRQLKSEGRQFLRNIHLTMVPDEEIGSHLGMGLFIDHPEYHALNPGITLDEGLASPTDEFSVFYGEKCVWWITVHCRGDPGHGSRFIENTAATKMHSVITSFLNFREKEKKRLESNPDLTLGDVITINLTKVNGGVSCNVIPSEMSTTFDLRIPPTMDLKEFELQIESWCRAAGMQVTFEFHKKSIIQKITTPEDSNPWWKAFSDPCKEMGLKMKPEIFPAATDSQYIRAAGFDALGFSPMNNTPILLHDHNEHLNEDIFLRGIKIYSRIIGSLASVPPLAGEEDTETRVCPAE
ncbi:aminoacylase-1-like isoform X1 [Dendropsophus ebraccatus]|uniref:aminoacylase-1-like isoform X1 n=1 Tax=Dendropsophus ebraccatus TaxID=150705 RepID=UPI0038312B73